MIRRVLLFVVVVLVVAGLAAGWMYQRVSRPFQRYEGPEQFVDLAPGDNTAVIGRKLVESGVVTDRWTFRLALWRAGAARRLKAGEYRFDRPMTPLEVVDKLARGDVYMRPITFPEGLTIKEMSRIFEGRGLGKASAFVQAARHTELIADLDPAAHDLEGYLFPETYSLSRHAGAPELVKMMVARFRQVAGASVEEAAAARHQTVRQIVTLASIVEKETASPEERPMVAGVYAQRLRVGMPLQCDPTVIYALEAAGSYHGNLTKEGLGVDSRYNTYRYPGLPPGPIASPSRTSLQAAEHPADVSYLYFVSRNDGTHVFARTLDEHNRNVHKYQVEYFRQKRAQERH